MSVPLFLTVLPAGLVITNINNYLFIYLYHVCISEYRTPSCYQYQYRTPRYHHAISTVYRGTTMFYLDIIINVSFQDGIATLCTFYFNVSALSQPCFLGSARRVWRGTRGPPSGGHTEHLHLELKEVGVSRDLHDALVAVPQRRLVHQDGALRAATSSSAAAAVQAQSCIIHEYMIHTRTECCSMQQEHIYDIIILEYSPFS